MQKSSEKYKPENYGIAVTINASQHFSSKEREKEIWTRKVSLSVIQQRRSKERTATSRLKKDFERKSPAKRVKLIKPTVVHSRKSKCLNLNVCRIRQQKNCNVESDNTKP